MREKTFQTQNRYKNGYKISESYIQLVRIKIKSIYYVPIRFALVFNLSSTKDYQNGLQNASVKLSQHLIIIFIFLQLKNKRTMLPTIFTQSARHFNFMFFFLRKLIGANTKCPCI